MEKKRTLGVIIVALIISMNTVLIFAKTDSASRSFECRGIDVSGKASVSISSGLVGINTAKSNGSITGSDIGLTSKDVYYTKVNLNTCYGTKSYKMYDGCLKGSTTTKGYNMWQATMRVYNQDQQLVSWSVCCS